MTLYTHLAINIFSTILLSASNNCAQLLSAPTRDDISKSHANGKWLDIGVPSVRNLRYIPWQRSLLWAVLMLSSLPLHLLYNSVIFETSSTHLYEATLVTDEFTTGGWWNHSAALTQEESMANGWRTQADAARQIRALQDYQNNIDQLQRLSNADCIRLYDPSKPINAIRGNVLVVLSSSNTRKDNRVRYLGKQKLERFVWKSPSWMCQDYGLHGDDYYWNHGCGLTPMIQNAENWSIQLLECNEHPSQACTSRNKAWEMHNGQVTAYGTCNSDGLDAVYISPGCCEFKDLVFSQTQLGNPDGMLVLHSY